MDLFNAYLPIDRRYALVLDQPLPDRTQGAVLFADISGFTPLGEILAKAFGPQRGAEELTRQLDLVFGAVIAQAHDYSGSVIVFSGDAITCWFDDHPIGHSHTLESGARRATACALAMQEVMARFHSHQVQQNITISLGIKVSVTAGEVRRFSIGAPQIQIIDVLAGRLLDRMAASEHLLNQGEVIVGAEVVEQFANTIDVREWRSSKDGERFAVVNKVNDVINRSPWSKPPTVNSDLIRPWLLPPVFDRLQAGASAFLAELRPVAALFINFSGIDYDSDETAEAKLQEYLVWVQTTLYRYDGFLMQMAIGDKGNYFLAALGATMSHEGEAVRAIKVARALVSLPEELNYINETRIGISIGLMHVGNYGGRLRRTFSLQGTNTNLAARLMSLAKPGQILVSPSLYAATNQEYEFDDLGTFALKGISDSMPVWLLQGERGPETETIGVEKLEAPIIGRSNEQAILRSLYLDLVKGQGASVVIEGEAGIGKSTLVRALLKEIRTPNMPILIGSGDAIEKSTAYHAWRSIFRSLFTVDERLDPENILTQVMAQVLDDPEYQQLLPLLNAVLPLNLPDNEITSKMVGEARANSTRSLLVKLLTSKYQHATGIILVLDDAQWLDSASWAMLAQTRQVLPNLMVVIVTRRLREMDELPKEFEQLLNSPNLTHIQLANLDREQVVDLLMNTLGVTEIADAVIEFVHHLAGGHPFFSQEIAYALREAGLIRVEEGCCVVANKAGAFQNLEFPDTIQGVIRSRIDRLETSRQLALKVASVIGRIFALRVLQHIYPIANRRDDLPSYMESLERLDLIMPQSIEPDLDYIFKHLVTQEVAYNLMTFSQRKQLHRGAAQWYENQYGSELDPFYPLMAFHWQNAEDGLKAKYYLEQAGLQALRNSANREAIHFFQDLRSLDESADLGSDFLTKARWARLLAEAYFASGDIRKGQEYYEEALTLLEQPLPKSQGRLVVSLLRETASQTLHRLWSSRYVKSNNEDLTSREASHVYHGLAVIYYFDNESLAFTHATLRALNLAEKTGPSRELAEGYATLCVICSLVPGLNVSESYAQMAMETAELLNDPSILGNVLLRISVYHSGVGHWERAQETAEKAISNYQTINDVRGWGDSINALMQTLTIYGRFEESAKLSRELQQVAQENDNPQHLDWGLWMEAKNLIRLGQIENAIERIEAAIAIEDKQVNNLQQLHLYGARALAYWYFGNPEEAINSLQKVDITVAAATPGYATLSAITQVAETYLLAWEASRNNVIPTTDAELAELISGAEQSCKAIKSYSRIFPIGKPAAQLYQGKLEWLKGNANKAYKAWANCLTQAKDLNMLYELARADFELGLNLPEGDETKVDHLRKAIDIFERLGTVADLERAQTALLQP